MKKDWQIILQIALEIIKISIIDNFLGCTVVECKGASFDIFSLVGPSLQLYSENITNLYMS